MRQTLIIDQHHCSLEYDNGCLLLRSPDKPVRKLPLRYLDKVVCLHHTDLQTQALAQMRYAGVNFVYLNARNSDLSFALQAEHQAQCLRRCAQYEISMHHSAVALQLAQHWVRYKITCSRRALQASEQYELRSSPASLQALLNHLLQLQQHITAQTPWPTLRGIEGLAQRQIFAHWCQQLPPQLGFTQRLRRPPPDPVNAILSLSYTMAMHEAIRQCLHSGLDPWLGFYHRPAHGRQSLASDLMEPLRAHIESWVVGVFQTGQLSLREFSHGPNGCLLGKQGRKTYYEQWYTQAPQWAQQLNHLARRLARGIDRHARMSHLALQLHPAEDDSEAMF